MFEKHVILKTNVSSKNIVTLGKKIEYRISN